MKETLLERAFREHARERGRNIYRLTGKKRNLIKTDDGLRSPPLYVVCAQQRAAGTCG